MPLFGRSFSVFSPGNRRGAMVPYPVVSMSSVAVSSGVLVAQGIVTDAQMKLIMGTPVELVPAEVGTMICVVSLHAFANVTANGGIGVNVTARYGAALQTAIASFTAVAAVNGIRQSANIASTFNILGATDLRGANINLIGTANAGAGYTTTGGWRWRLTYFKLVGG